MPEWITWVFDGFGTQIICLFIGTVIGGISGFYIGKHNEKMKQEQKAGSNSEQVQVGVQKQREKEASKKADKQDKANSKQSQKAGDNSRQIQIGGQNDE